MNFKADPLIIKTLGTFRIGIIQSCIQCSSSTSNLKAIIESDISKIQKQFKLDDVKKVPPITETREAYKKLGNDPNRYRPSADSLIRRIVKGMGIYYINNVVDILNFISIQSGFSIGGYDSSKISGDVEIGIGKESELYHGIGRGPVNILNLPVLRDEKGAFGSPTSDSQRTMIQVATKSILFIFFDFGCNASLPEFLSKCAEYLTNYCSAKKLFINSITLK